LVVAGRPGWNCSSILKAIDEQQALGRVRYLGMVEDCHLAALYSAARLLVCPSVYEGFGLPVLEAMACGCPVLCSWTSSLPEVAGDAGRYFRVRDVAGLARNLAMLVADPKALGEMSRAGLRRASLFGFRAAGVRVVEMVREGAAQRAAVRVSVAGH
jgi:alpha-1,3-rhamnosyl/mannosyltransferase